MGRVQDHIDEGTTRWLSHQHMFFVSTAPAQGGHVNVSPKGLDSLRVLGPQQVAYLDLTGSAAETIAHLRDNGRITFMFCAFEGPPRIVRLYGTGTVNLPGSDPFIELMNLFPQRRAVRALITVDVDRVQDSCGYSVPLMDFSADRTRLDSWADQRSDEEIEAYWYERNGTSIDGLPAIDTP